MKNIIPAILSIVIGFALTTFGINLSKKNNFGASFNKVDATEKVKVVQSEKKSDTKKAIIPKKKTVQKQAVSTPSETTNSKGKVSLQPNVDPISIQTDYKEWNTYNKENIDLMSSFTPIDDKGSKMKKSTFLSLLRTGAYIPIKLEGSNAYQLFGLDRASDKKIGKSIRGTASIARSYFRMEGKKLPEYDFVDLNGVSYNKADTKGKLLILKCWFINCTVCVEEFPKLNALVDRYKDNDNISFVSLAFDEGDKLKKFLENKTFKYAVIPEQKKYMSKKLKVKQYPTHLIVDENGVILKMVNNVDSLISELDQIMANNEKE